MRYRAVLMCPDYAATPKPDKDGNMTILPRKQTHTLSKRSAETWAETMLAGAPEGSYVDVFEQGWTLERRVDKD